MKLSSDGTIRVGRIFDSIRGIVRNVKKVDKIFITDQNISRVKNFKRDKK